MISVAFSEQHAVLAKIDPASYATQQTTAWVDVGRYNRIVALIQVGAIAATGTFDAKIRQAQDSGGTGAKEIGASPYKAITQLADSDDNKVLCIEVRTAELDVSGGFEHVRLELTPATAATIVGAALIGAEPRYKPVPTTNYHQIVK